MLMSKAFFVGIHPSEFWDLTMRELMICIEAYELKHYGIVDGKNITSNDQFSSYEEWKEAWQESWDNPTGALSKLTNGNH